MYRRRGVGVGGLNEAEDLSVLPVHPVAEIADVVASLGLQVRLVCFAHVIEGDCTIEAMDVPLESGIAPPLVEVETTVGVHALLSWELVPHIGVMTT